MEWWLPPLNSAPGHSCRFVGFQKLTDFSDRHHRSVFPLQSRRYDSRTTIFSPEGKLENLTCFKESFCLVFFFFKYYTFSGVGRGATRVSFGVRLILFVL